MILNGHSIKENKQNIFIFHLSYMWKYNYF